MKQGPKLSDGGMISDRFLKMKQYFILSRSLNCGIRVGISMVVVHKNLVILKSGVRVFGVSSQNHK